MLGFREPQFTTAVLGGISASCSCLAVLDTTYTTLIMLHCIQEHRETFPSSSKVSHRGRAMSRH